MFLTLFVCLFVCLLFNGLLQSICYRMFSSKHSITFEKTYLLSCWFDCVDIFYIKFRFCETFTEINSVTRTLLIETLSKFRTVKCWFTLYIHMYVLGLCKFKCFVYSTKFSCVSHSIDTCTVVIKNIRNMHAVSTNHIADIMHFNNESIYIYIYIYIYQWRINYIAWSVL